MACFVVPAAEAVIATVAVQIAKKHEISQEKLECKLPEGAVQAPEYKISVSRKLSWLRNLLWGGVLLLAFEHLWHGELTPYFPFLTGASNAEDTATMLHEMATVGVATSLFNALISKAGYVAPKLVDGVTVAAQQSQAVKNMITFSFVGLETITGIILAVLLIFLSVEKTLSRKQAKIREYQQAEAAARGEEWVAPEVRAAEEEAKYLHENELAFEAALKEKCAAKGLYFEKELADYQKAAAEKAAKAEEKKRLAEEKEKAKAEKAKARKDARLAAMSPEDRLKKEQKEAKRAEAEEAAWQRELAAGEAYRAKIQAELAAKGE